MALGLVLAGVVACGIALLPAVANYYGYARPFFGLPSRFEFAHGTYQDPYTCRGAAWCSHLPPDWQRAVPHCASRSLLERISRARRLVRVSNVPTVFGPPHPVVWPLGAANILGIIAPWLFVQDGSCYVPYHIAR
ncbi:MAG: hypothetical protein JOZ41_03090 [Chloroflexi bacterium]|nr:hypothetical protein [Chloroflexota bacterium]